MTEAIIVDFTYTRTHLYLFKEMCNRYEPINSNGIVIPKHQWSQASDLIRNNLAVWNTARDDPYVRIRITEKGLEAWTTLNNL